MLVLWIRCPGCGQGSVAPNGEWVKCSHCGVVFRTFRTLDWGSLSAAEAAVRGIDVPRTLAEHIREHRPNAFVKIAVRVAAALGLL